MRDGYSERLWVPAAWWLVGMFFAVSFVTAIGFWVSGPFAVTAGLVTAVAVAAVLLAHGSRRIVVDGRGVQVGRSLLGWEYIGEVQALDRATTSRRLGPGADPAAWLATRGYLHESVELAVRDDADPHPYWLVSTRRPAELVAAIEAVRSSREAGTATGRG